MRARSGRGSPTAGRRGRSAEIPATACRRPAPHPSACRHARIALSAPHRSPACGWCRYRADRRLLRSRARGGSADAWKRLAVSSSKRLSVHECKTPQLVNERRPRPFQCAAADSSFCLSMIFSDLPPPADPPTLALRASEGLSPPKRGARRWKRASRRRETGIHFSGSCFRMAASQGVEPGCRSCRHGTPDAPRPMARQSAWSRPRSNCSRRGARRTRRRRSRKNWPARRSLLRCCAASSRRCAILSCVG